MAFALGVCCQYSPLKSPSDFADVLKCLEDFAGDFPEGFFWALFPHRIFFNEEKASGKIRKKERGYLLWGLRGSFFEVPLVVLRFVPSGIARHTCGNSEGVSC